MSDLKFTEAFAKYGAKLVNAQWAFSAIAEDGSLVISCWQHKFTVPEKGVLRYSDRLSRFRPNSPGRKLLAAHLGEAQTQKLRVRLVIATTKETEAVDAGKDVSGSAKTFHLKENVVGKVASFDGDVYVIDFMKQEAGVPTSGGDQG